MESDVPFKETFRQDQTQALIAFVRGTSSHSIWDCFQNIIDWLTPCIISYHHHDQNSNPDRFASIQERLRIPNQILNRLPIWLLFPFFAYAFFQIVQISESVSQEPNF